MLKAPAPVERWRYVARGPMEGPGTREAPRGLAISEVIGATGSKRKTRLPRPRQVLSDSPRAAAYFSRMSPFETAGVRVAKVQSAIPRDAHQLQPITPS